jgi:hypothetical protein
MDAVTSNLPAEALEMLGLLEQVRIRAQQLVSKNIMPDQMALVDARTMVCERIITERQTIGLMSGTVCAATTRSAAAHSCVTG